MNNKHTPQEKYGSYGVILVVYAKSDAGPGAIIERSPNGTSNWEKIARFGSVELQGNHYVDRLPNDGTTRFYRARHEWDIGEPGEWSNIVAGRPIFIDPALDLDAKPWPSSIPVTLRIDIDDDGFVSLFADGSFRTKSIRWAINIDEDALPDVATGEIYNIDPEADPLDEDGDTLGITTIDTNVQLQPGELVRAGVKFFSEEEAEGNLLATHYDLARYIDPDFDANKLEPDFAISLEYFDQSGDPYVRVILDVTDPHESLDRVAYFWKSGPVDEVPDFGDFVPWSAQPGGLRYTQEIRLHEKHLGVLAFVAYWIDADAEERRFHKILWLDIGDDANIVDTHVHYSGDTTTAFVKVKGDADTQSMYVEEFRGGSWGPVFEPLSGVSGLQFSHTRRGQFSVRTEEDPRRFRVWGRNAQNKDGPSEEVFVSSRTELDAEGGPEIILERLDYLTENGTAIARAVVDIQDPFENLTEVKRITQKGPIQEVPPFSDFTVWNPQVFGDFEGFFVDTVELDKKHLSLIAVAARWIDNEGRNRITQKLLYIDKDEDADILFVEVYYTENGDVATVKVKGDADTAELRAQEFRGGSWGPVFEPLSSFDGDTFAETRRGSFVVNTEQSARRFRVWGISRAGQPGDFEEFSISTRLDIPETESEEFAFISTRAGAINLTPEGETVEIIVRFKAVSEVNSLSVSNFPDSGQVSSPFDQYTYNSINHNRSTWTAVTGASDTYEIRLRNNAGSVVGFPYDYPDDIRITALAYSSTNSTGDLLAQDFITFSQNALFDGSIIFRAGTQSIASKSINFDPQHFSLSIQNDIPVLSSVSSVNISAGTGLTLSNNQIALTGQALALHNLSTNGMITRTGLNTVAARSIAGGAGINVTNESGVEGNPSIAVDNTVVRTSGDQSIGGVKAFTGRISLLNLATTRVIGSFYAGTENPLSSTRLNFDGNLHANQLYERGARVLTTSSTLSYVPLARTVTAGAGLVNGGQLNNDITINMGTPGLIGGDTTNHASANSHTHALAPDVCVITVSPSNPSSPPQRPGDLWVVI